MRRNLFALMLAALMLALSACASSPKIAPSSPAPTQAQTAAPESTAEPSTAPEQGDVLPHVPAAYRTRFTADFYAFLSVDLSNVPIADNYPMVVSHISEYEKAAAVINECIVHSAAYAAEDMEKVSGMDVNIETNIEHPDWKYIGAFLYLSDQLFVSRNTASKTLKNSILADVELDFDDDDNIMDIVLNVKPDSFERLIDMLRAQTGMHTITGMLSYAYLKTAYDDEGNEIDYVLPEPSGNLLTGLVSPFEKRMRLRDSWYAPRDGGNRKHMGIDITAPEDTPILSCTSGVILYIGYDDVAGNFVAIRDDFGYQYYYMHMVRIPDFIHAGEAVNAGDVIGHVGNTGNSDTNHLHLSIISDEGLFVNPYPYLLQTA